MRSPPGLHTLARLHGVQTVFHDNEGERVSASPEALLATLRAMGEEIPDTGVLPERAERRRRALWERALDPVVVVRTTGERGPSGVAAGMARLRTQARLRGHAVSVTVGLEGGGDRESAPDPSSLEVLRSEELAGTTYVERAVPLPSMPVGYHDLRIEVGDGRSRRRHEAVLIAAPGRAPGWSSLPRTRRAGASPGDAGWGLFAPLYALHERGRPRDPSYATLARFAEHASRSGATVIGTLPLLASFLDRPYEPSPYSPVSRLFWNGMYVEPEASEQEPAGEPAAATVAGPAGSDRFLDPSRLMARRRASLEAEAARFFADGAEEPGNGRSTDLGGSPELEAFRTRNPLAEDYARFRALTEAHGPWPEWPGRLRARDVRPGDYDTEVARYHLYLQYRAERQLAEAEQQAARRGVSLYLDLPLGVHPDGYDVWRERSLFALGTSAGAPPDPLAAEGQDWGFPPMRPEASRLQGHRYFAASLRKHLRFARVLRIDHIMQLHRLYWVPTGDARDGVYVKYPAEELYAILCLEASRAGAVIVGEDLGTVPKRVRRDMRRRGVPGMYVLEFELTDTEAGRALEPRRAKPGALASIGTHDTPTFAGWWWGEDVRIRRELGQLDEEEAGAQLEGRGVMREKLVRGLGLHREDAGASAGTGPAEEASAGPAEEARAVQAELLRRMGRSEAGLVLATVEDLWLERAPQNVPGTTGEGNWRRRAARSLEALEDPDVKELLNVLNQSREGTE